jgi:hypothetical protein
VEKFFRPPPDLIFLNGDRLEPLSCGGTP